MLADPSWLPLNNAIMLDRPKGAAAAAASHVAGAYADAGVGPWAFWVPSRATDLDAPDDLREVGTFKRDTTTLVMRAVRRLAVAGAWSFLHGSDCGIYAVGTMPGWRRRGLSRALMVHVLGDAQRRAARTATLQSTRMGQPLYESLGFDPQDATRNGFLPDRETRPVAVASASRGST